MSDLGAVSGLDLVPLRMVLDRAWPSARKHLRQTFWPLSLPLVLIGVIAAFAQVRWLGEIGGLEPGSVPDFSVFLVLIAVGLVAGVLYGLSYSVLLVVAMNATVGRRIDIRRGWEFVLRPANFLTLLACGLATVASFMLCLAPAIFVLPVVSLVLPIMAIEGRTGTAAIARSLELASFNPSRRLLQYPWVQMAGVLFAGWAIATALSTAVQLPFIVLQQFLLVRDLIQGQSADIARTMSQQIWIQLPAQVLAAFATVIGWQYVAFATCRLFLEIRRRREGQDIELALVMIEARRGGAGAVGSAAPNPA